MEKWHDIMMRSSKSFRECHENGKYGEDNTKTEMVNDYISITRQSGGSTAPHYWGIYPSEKGLEVGKKYQVIINDELYESVAIEYEGMPAVVEYDYDKNAGLILKYNTNNGNYLINYYNEEMTDSNPTVNFEVYEMMGEEKEKEKIKLFDSIEFDVAAKNLNTLLPNELYNRFIKDGMFIVTDKYKVCFNIKLQRGFLYTEINSHRTEFDSTYDLAPVGDRDVAFIYLCPAYGGTIGVLTMQDTDWIDSLYITAWLEEK